MTPSPPGDDVVFVVGAPRSGTKILRDTLYQHPAVETHPHNLNTVWEIGQPDRSHHEYPLSSLDHELKQTLRDRFRGSFPARPGSILLEKNICHSLRMEYVRAVFPGARFVHIVRHAPDAISSTRHRWKHPNDWSYILGSALRTWSAAELLLPGLRALLRSLPRRLGRRDPDGLWGPLPRALVASAHEQSLLENAAMQWKLCVEGVLSFRENHTRAPVHRVRYEELIRRPESTLPPLCDFLDLTSTERILDFAREHYRAGSLERWRSDLTEEEQERLRARVEPTMRRLGYRWTDRDEDSDA